MATAVLGESLANDLARDDEAAAVLQEHMTWRVPIELKLKLLSQAMDSYALAEIYPFVIPVLAKLFQVRNILAHSMETPAPEERREVGFLSVHRGRITERSIRMDTLAWLWHQGNEVFEELLLISGALRDLRDYEHEEASAAQLEAGQPA